MSELEKCPQCGFPLKKHTTYLNGGNYYIVVYCTNPKCNYMKPIAAKGEIPFEAEMAYFPGRLKEYE